MTPLPHTIDEVITHLELIVEESIHRQEREGYFAALYLRVTREIKNKISAGFFDDNARMEHLDVVFANRYLSAYAQYKNHSSCPASWQVAFEACRRWPPLAMHHLIIAMNAHIGFDLGIAAATVCPGQFLESMENDFKKINDVLAGLIGTVRNEVTALWPMLRPVNALAGSLEEEIAKFSMEKARQAAWQEALQYAALNTDVQRLNYTLLRDNAVATFGSKLAEPGILVSTLMCVLRVFEHGSIKQKIEVLNSKQVPSQDKNFFGEDQPMVGTLDQLRIP